MPPAPYFSLIVPIYNTEAYLPRCVQSVLEQDFTDYELILVNDGSTDSCAELCEAYANQFPRIRVLHQENGGISCARNAGLQLARGQWVWFIDSDDSLLPGALAELHRLQSTYHAQLYVFNREQEGLHSGTMDELLEKYWYNYTLGFPVWNKLYKRRIIKDHHLSFDPMENLGEDMLFNLEYYQHIDSVYFSAKELYAYCVREKSAMSSPSQEWHRNHMRLYGKIREKLAGTISPLNMGMLYFMNLECGLTQAGYAGLSQWKQTLLAWQYRKDFPGNRAMYRRSLKNFLELSPHFSRKRKLYWWVTLALLP